MLVKAIREFLRLEAASGILLVVAALLAMFAANSGLSPLYEALLATPVEVRVGDFQIAKPLLLWINDGLMAVFFFLVGLELKREVLEGELSRPAQVILPVVAAVGGMVAPAVMYAFFNWGDATAMRGWAIPTATDIAFALGILSMLGNRVPAALKIFLMTLAIADDLGAIVVIALFYTETLSMNSALVALAALAVLAVMNARGVRNTAPFLFVGLVLWAAVLKSGVHATIGGVVLALFIPLRGGPAKEQPPLRKLEEDLHPPVAYAILPLFGFANAGVSLAGVTWEALVQPVPLGIAAGLFVGKQIGVFGFSWLAIQLGLARLPKGVGWIELYGVSVLCGVGFTMSLFVGSLAFVPGDPHYGVDDRLGILVGSLFSALGGYLLLRVALGRRAARGDA